MRILGIVLLGLFFLSTTFTVTAQTEKGNFLLGGDTHLDFTSLNSKWKTDNDSGDNTNTTYLEFSPQVGFFVADGLAIGAEVPIVYSSETEENDDELTFTSISFTPFVRYYFGASNIKPYLHGQGGLGTSRIKVETETESYDNPSRILSYEVGGGLGIFFNKSISLDIGLGYSSRSSKPETEDNEVEFENISNRFGMKIGFVIIL